VWPQKAHCEKDANPRWQPRNGCDGRLMTNNNNLGEFGALPPWISYNNGFLGAAHFFIAGLFWIRLVQLLISMS